MKVFDKEYSEESLIDLEEDLHYALYESGLDIPEDENGFRVGTFSVVINWEDD